MDVFDLGSRLVSDYRSYPRSFIRIRDPRIETFVEGILGAEGFWPEPLLQLNPTFRPGGTIDDLVASGILHPECARILHTYRGRQGSDIAMLIRRCRHAFGNDVICVGTSATIAIRRHADIFGTLRK